MLHKDSKGGGMQQLASTVRIALGTMLGCRSELALWLLVGLLQGTTCKSQTSEAIAEQIEQTCERIRATAAGQEGISKDSSHLPTSEGREATAYTDTSGICLIRMIGYGETGRDESDYYFQHDTLIFVHQDSYRYNRPFYWDAEHAKQNGDTVVFDPALTRLEEGRLYFQHHNLVLWLDHAGAPVDFTQGINSVVGQATIGYAQETLRSFK